MRSAAVLALLLCAGQAIALPVSSPVNKGDTEVMKCIVEVISDTLSKPSPMPVSQECFETLRGDERILSILRHQNLLKELQDLALQGAKERAHQKKHSSSEDGLAEAPDKQNDQAERKEVTGEASPKDAVEKREDSKETENDGDTDGARPQASQEPGRGPQVEGDSQAPGQQEAANTHSLASLPGQKHPDSQAEEDSEGLSQGLVDTEKGPGAEQGQQAKREEEEEEEEETGEKAATEEENPTEALNPHPSLGHQETHRGESWPEAQAVDEAPKTEAKEARPPEGEGEPEHSRQEEEEEEEEEMAEAPRGLFRGGKNRELEQEQKEEQLSKDWEGAKRWRMDQLAKELTAKKGLQGEDEDDDPDRSMKLSFRARAYDFRGPGLPLRRGWRPTSREDSVEASLPLQVRGYVEEKKEEEGSANRRPEDQELETLTTIEAELEKVAQQLQALRRG